MRTPEHHMLHPIHWIFDSVICGRCPFGWSDTDPTHRIPGTRVANFDVFEEMNRYQYSIGGVRWDRLENCGAMVDGLFKRFLISGLSNFRFSAQSPPVAVKDAKPRPPFQQQFTWRGLWFNIKRRFDRESLACRGRKLGMILETITVSNEGARTTEEWRIELGSLW